MDLGRKAQFFTLDVISSIGFGKAFGFLISDSDVHQYIEMTEMNLPFMSILSLLPSLVKFVHSPLLSWMIPSEKDVLGLGHFIRQDLERTFCLLQRC